MRWALPGGLLARRKGSRARSRNPVLLVGGYLLSSNLLELLRHWFRGISLLREYNDTDDSRFWCLKTCY